MRDTNIDTMNHIHSSIIGLLIGVLVALSIVITSNLSTKTKAWLFLWLTMIGGAIGAMVRGIGYDNGPMHYFVLGSIINLIVHIVAVLFSLLG